MSKSKFAAILIFQMLCMIIGGTVSVCVSAAGLNPAPSSGTTVYSVVVLVLLALIVGIEIVSAIKIHDSTVHTVYSSFALLVFYFFSYDMMEVFNPLHTDEAQLAVEFVNYIAFNFVAVVHLYLLDFLYKLKTKPVEWAVLSVYSVADCALYVMLTSCNLQYIAQLAYAPAFIYVLVKPVIIVAKRRKADTTFFLIMTILAAVAGMQFNTFLYDAGLYKFRVYGIDATYMLVVYFSFLGVYISFILRTERAALKASEYKLQAERLKTKMLREQMNPHYIFNSLITVKDAYRSDVERGDMAMNYFSRHLRANVEAMNLDCVPLEDELDNVENYIGLENMKRKKPVKIYYSIEYDDFKLPVLSLQTFVENAVKYARLDENDGCIFIASYKTDNGAAVEISDNGAGFNVEDIKETSCGIRNAKERFKLLLNAEVNIDSAPGKGTKIKILIPEEKEGETEGSDADNNS